MSSASMPKQALIAGILGALVGCDSSSGGGGGGGSSTSAGGSGGTQTSIAAGGTVGTGGSAVGGTTTGGSTVPAATGGKTGSGGATVVKGGSSGTGPGSTGGQIGAGTTAKGGAVDAGQGIDGLAPRGTGGTSSPGTQPDGGVTSSCVPTKTWGTVDPSSPGPFEIVIEKNTGPAAGQPDAKWNNEVPHFNLYRPKDMSQGYCHPVVTWGNGTGDQPPTYEVLIKQLASHGFVVVASLSSQTAKGTPLPQIAGVEWMIQENQNPSSALYRHLDLAHVGATGHSQGGMATTLSGADPRVTAIVPICGSSANVTLHGPALLICGGADTMVPCSRVQPAFDSITNMPVMMAELAGVTHGSWIGSIKDPVMVGTTGWMRVHLMNDTANRGMFYGPSCKVCSDSKWKVQRKMMDQ